MSSSTKSPVCIVATKIIQTAVEPDVGLSDLAKLAESDPGFAFRVLAVVNSAAFMRTRRVGDVRQACALLGVRGLRNLALGLVVSDMIPTGEVGELLFSISMRRAVAARLIAEALKERQPDDAFTAGMFLELALLTRAREDLTGAAKIARMPALHRPIVERAFGYEPHQLEGSRMGAELGLPEEIMVAVAHHHDENPPVSQLGKIVWAAERTAAAWEGGDVAQGKDAAMGAMMRIGIQADVVRTIMDEIPQLVISTAAAFDRQVLPQSALEKLAANANAQLVELNNTYAQLVRRLEDLVAEKEQLATDLQRANAELASLAATDALTGLPNKRSFRETLARELALADRNKTPLSLVVVDVDHFKSVNDTYGHAVGDVVLAHLGNVLKSALRTSDFAARYGGEEFVLLLPCTPEQGAAMVAERVRAALAETPVVTTKGALDVRASLGVASVVGPGCRASGDDLFARADAALYAAKTSGRNRVVCAATAAAAA
ncbi:MAG TPA: diguanylate cyclase [Polyangiaceae bacterium]